ncbi:hypothetical protein Lal_00015335 [Lupinus albus]|nr:hypothetical protein Lal_00015335 [Lupinus albus]
MSFFDRIYKWLFTSLANQLLITYLVVITIALLAVSMWALVAIRHESMTDLRNSLEVEAINLGLEIDNDLVLDSPKALARIQAAVERRATRLGVAIAVVDRVGRLLADSSPLNMDPVPREGTNLSREKEINEALTGIISNSTRAEPGLLPGSDRNWLYVACPVRSMGETTGVIRVGVPLTEIERRLRKDLIVFLEIILATGFVTILISLGMARRFNKPVREMSALARQISNTGDLSALLPVRRQDEIGELSASFNQMIGRLREQERLRQEFISNASHELKTPTMAIGGVVEALQAGASEDPALRTKLRKKWHDHIDVARLVQEAVEQIRVQADKKQLNISTQILLDMKESPGRAVVGNSSQLQRAVVNILTNSIKYTPEGGSITVSARLSAGNRVEIRIQDTGSGIEPQDLPHIFERFYRADKARTRETGGTGLGLAIVRDIVVMHNGHVEVESTVGQGSVFVIHLPLRDV